MSTVTASSRPNRGWQIYLLKTIMVLLVGGVFAGQLANSINASELVVDDLAVRSTQLEAAGQWPELVSLCETAARKGKLSNELYQRYDLAKIHCDLDRRSAEKAYQEALRHITEGEARQLFVECLGTHKLSSRYQSGFS